MNDYLDILREASAKQPVKKRRRGPLTATGVVSAYHRMLKGNMRWTLKEYSILHPDAIDKPLRCPGAGKPKQGEYVCEKTMYCFYCYKRRMWGAAFLGVALHGQSQQAYGVVLNHPWLWQDVDHALTARREVAKLAREHGFDRHQLYVQHYGEKPWEGMKFHLDGVVSGPKEADATGLGDAVHAWIYEQARGTANPFANPPHIEEIVPEWSFIMKRAAYAGRQTFPTGRLIAGREGVWPTYRYLMTNVGDGSTEATIQPIVRNGQQAWVNTAEVVEWLRETESMWKRIAAPASTRGVELPLAMQRAILEHVPDHRVRTKNGRPYTWAHTLRRFRLRGFQQSYLGCA